MVMVDVAHGKPTYASPQWGSYFKYLAVDGDETADNFYASGDYITQPWWIVDLGKQFTIYRVIVLPRWDYFYTRFHDVEVRVGDELVTSGDLSSYKLFSTYTGPYSPDQEFLYCNRMDGVAGRYLSIQRIGSVIADLLQLCEIFVMVPDINI
ncbi:uncharacterized protein [Procambarus clarkii]|uniref:uncharacterized protein n=1 Tax=Procambarus clarkii TaxID=6728 RepID=UPI003742E081